VLLQIHNLGHSGVVSDRDPTVLPLEAISYGENYKVVNDKIVSAYNDKLTVTQTITQACGHVFWAPNTSFYITMARTLAAVYNGSAWSNITDTGGYAAAIGTDQELLWTHCMIGNIPIVNNPQVWPSYWSPQQTTQVLQPLNFNAGNTWKFLTYHAKVIRSHNNFLFALNLTEGATVYPTSYRWSHPADVNGLPYTWDETDLAAIAGKASIGVGGDIIDGMTLRDAFVIYSRTAITVLDYVGGEFIWSSRTLTTSHGLLAVNCVIEVNGVHYFMSVGDIMANDGNSVTSILSNRIKDNFVATMSPTKYANSFVCSNLLTKEIWFCYPEIGNTYPSKAIVLNYEFNTLTQRTLIQRPYATFGPQLTAQISWTTVADTWDSIGTPWGSDLSASSTNTIVAANTSGDLYSLEIYDVTNIQGTIAEREGIIVNDQMQVFTTTSVYPNITSTGSVWIQLGAQDFAGYPVRWQTASLFTPSTMRKVEQRATGSLLAWRVFSDGATPFTLTGLDIEYTLNGVR